MTTKCQCGHDQARHQMMDRWCAVDDCGCELFTPISTDALFGHALDPRGDAAVPPSDPVGQAADNKVEPCPFCGKFPAFVLLSGHKYATCCFNISPIPVERWNQRPEHDRLTAELEQTREELVKTKARLSASHQSTNCGKCGQFKHTPWRDDEYGYVCATCLVAIKDEEHDGKIRALAESELARERMRPLASFGQAVLSAMSDHAEVGFDEWMEELAEIGFKHGVVERVAYNPEVHGSGDCFQDFRPGDEMWWWGNAAQIEQPSGTLEKAPSLEPFALGKAALILREIIRQADAQNVKDLCEDVLALIGEPK